MIVTSPTTMILSMNLTLSWTGGNTKKKHGWPSVGTIVITYIIGADVTFRERFHCIFLGLPKGTWGPGSKKESGAQFNTVMAFLCPG